MSTAISRSFQLMLLLLVFSLQALPGPAGSGVLSDIQWAHLIVEGKIIKISNMPAEDRTVSAIIEIQVLDIIHGNFDLPVVTISYDKNARCDREWVQPRLQEGDYAVFLLERGIGRNLVPMGGALGIFAVQHGKVTKNAIPIEHFKAEIRNIRANRPPVLNIPDPREDTESPEATYIKLDGEFTYIYPNEYGPPFGQTIVFHLNPAGAYDINGNPISSEGSAYESLRAAVQRAMDTWNNSPHSYTTFSLAPDAYTQPRQAFDGISTITFEQRTDNGEAKFDRINEPITNGGLDIILASGNWDPDAKVLDVGLDKSKSEFTALAKRYIHWNTDVNYPTQYVLYATPYNLNSNTLMGPVDLEDVLAHELGHAIGLGHNPAHGNWYLYTMYPTIYNYNNKWWEKTWRRDLELGDMAGKAYHDPLFSGDATLQLAKMVLSKSKSVTFNGWFTVPQGYYLEIDPGTNIKIAPFKSVIAEGQIVANGTSDTRISFNKFPSPNTQQWGSIDLLSGPNFFKFCDFVGGIDGLWINNQSTTAVENCTFTSCYDGITVFAANKNSNASCRIKNSTFTSNDHALSILNGRADIFSSTISSSNYDGIYVSNSRLFLDHVAIAQNSTSGVSISGSTGYATFSADISGLPPGNNTINDNAGDEIKLANGAQAFLGHRMTYVCGYDCGGGGGGGGGETKTVPAGSAKEVNDDGGGGGGCTEILCTKDVSGSNKILSTLGYLVNNQSATNVLAELNWWGFAPPRSTGFYGSVDRTPYLTSAPFKTMPVRYEAPEVYSSSDGEAEIDTFLLRHLLTLAASNDDDAELALHMLSTYADSDFDLLKGLNLPWESILRKLERDATKEKVKSHATAYKVQARLDRGDFSNGLAMIGDILARPANRIDDDLWLFCQTQRVGALLRSGERAEAHLAYNAIEQRARSLSPETMDILKDAINNHSIMGNPAPGQVIAEHESERVSDTGGKSGLPKTFSLTQNYPNPFNPSTLINYELPEDAHVVLKVYNMLGQEVATLVDEDQSSGYKTAQFDAQSLATGVYVYRLTAGSFTDVKKMLLVR